MKRFLPALLLFSFIAGTAPAAGQVRDALFLILPDSAVPLLVAIAGLAATAALVFAVYRIQTDNLGRRRLRYTGLVGFGVLLWLETVAFETDLAKVNAVEKFHVIEYGLLGFLLYRAVRTRRDPKP